jgi:hypothetical protein
VCDTAWGPLSCGVTSVLRVGGGERDRGGTGRGRRFPGRDAAAAAAAACEHQPVGGSAAQYPPGSGAAEWRGASVASPSTPACRHWAGHRTGIHRQEIGLSGGKIVNL